MVILCRIGTGTVGKRRLTGWLHGVNMPLALVGYEAILARVWKKMGLTDEEINSYFVGPAHLPWMRMGNISGVDGPLMLTGMQIR